MNIYDISKKSKVSIATVSRVINGSENVSAATRKKVLKVIEECGYTPNAFARGLGLNSMKTVGILCVNIEDYYFSEAIYHVVKNIRENNYDSILIFTGDSLESKRKNLNSLLSKRVDGIILLGSSYAEADDTNNDYIREAAKQVPIVMMNGYIDGENIFCCLPDEYKAIYDMTSTFLKNEQKHILYLYRNLNYSARQKQKGFEDALTHHQSTSGSPVQISSGKVNDVKAILEKMEANGASFDAIICADDEIAVGALKYALAHGKKVPDEICIVGYNNSKLSICTYPEITSIDPNISDLASLSVKNLMDSIQGVITPQKSLIATKLIRRKTY